MYGNALRFVEDNFQLALSEEPARRRTQARRQGRGAAGCHQLLEPVGRVAGLSQEDVRALVGIPQHDCSEIENDLQTISLKTLGMLADAVATEAWRVLQPPRYRVR